MLLQLEYGWEDKDGEGREKRGGGRRTVKRPGRELTFTVGDPRGGQISGQSEVAVVIIDVLGVE